MAGKRKSTLLLERPHRRLNALTGEWVFVSPQRLQRPWQGALEPVSTHILSAHDPECYLCPGNSRANGERNPDYTSTYVFTNDFPAFLPEGESVDVGLGELLRAETRLGTCRVLCYSPRHDLTLGELPKEQLLKVIETWSMQEAELLARWGWVQIFENKGELMGCSNPHPHGQIWAGDFIPNEVAKEVKVQGAWYEAHGRPLLLEYATLELRLSERTVVHNEHWLAVIPWWGVWPFEVLLLPRRHARSLTELTGSERRALAEILKTLLNAYDRLFGCPFPYSFGWHPAPSGSCREEHAAACQLHAHFYPPLLRSRNVRKFLVGYEMLGEAQRDLTPEEAAEHLRTAGGESAARV